MERFGIRTVVGGALLAIATGVALTTQMSAPWQMYLLWDVTVGLGTGSMATVLAATVTTRWFVKRRGSVVGVLAAARATVLPTVAITSKEIGVARGPLVYGWVFAAHQVGAAFAAYAAGLSRTLMGDYVFVFNAAAMLSMIAARCALRIGTPSFLPSRSPQPQATGN